MAGSGRAFLEETGWDQMAEQGAFLVAAPDGLGQRPGLEPNVVLNPSQWDSGQPGRNRLRSRVDDLGFFDALDADIRRRWPVDSSRVYLVGHSNGASMSFRLAAARAQRFAAIVAVAGHCWIDDPRPARPVPTLWFVGTNDPLRPIHGGLTILPWEVRRTPPLSETLVRWGRANGFDPNTPEIDRQTPGVVVRRYGPDPAAPLLELVLISGHGHAWPGHPRSVPPGARAFFGPNTATIDATDWSWRFLRARSLPPP
jgi:polyhydroxybutyrate depolymerase